MTDALHGRAFVLPLCLQRIDRSAHVRDSNVALELDLSGFQVQRDFGPAHPRLPKERQLRPHAAAGTHVSAADQLAARHAKEEAYDFTVTISLARNANLTVFEGDRGRARMKYLCRSGEKLFTQIQRCGFDRAAHDRGRTAGARRTVEGGCCG